MKIMETGIPGALVIEPKRVADSRGYFFEAYQAERYSSSGIRTGFVQDNFSRSEYGVLRGMHLQYPESQAKLITVISGKILDVVVDVRVGSPTFGQYISVELSSDNGLQLFAPRGFAHGFITLSDQANLFYKCDAYYHPEHEIVLRWDDPALGIDWRIDKPKLSARDQAGLRLSEIPRLPSYAS